MMPTTPFQFELSQLVLLDRERKPRTYGRPARARVGLTRRSLQGMGRVMVQVGGRLEEIARPSDIFDQYGEGGVVI